MLTEPKAAKNGKCTVKERERKRKAERGREGGTVSGQRNGEEERTRQ